MALSQLYDIHSRGSEQIVQGNIDGLEYRRLILPRMYEHNGARENAETFRCHLEHAGDVFRRRCTELIPRTIRMKLADARAILDKWELYTQFYTDHMGEFEAEPIPLAGLHNIDEEREYYAAIYEESVGAMELNNNRNGGKGFMCQLRESYLSDLGHAESAGDGAFPDEIMWALSLMVALVTHDKGTAEANYQLLDEHYTLQ